MSNRALKTFAVRKESENKKSQSTLCVREQLVVFFSGLILCLILPPHLDDRRYRRPNRRSSAPSIVVAQSCSHPSEASCPWSGRFILFSPRYLVSEPHRSCQNANAGAGAGWAGRRRRCSRHRRPGRSSPVATTTTKLRLWKRKMSW